VLIEAGQPELRQHDYEEGQQVENAERGCLS
jgi:hypothetical protein